MNCDYRHDLAREQDDQMIYYARLAAAASTALEETGIIASVTGSEPFIYVDVPFEHCAGLTPARIEEIVSPAVQAAQGRLYQTWKVTSHSIAVQALADDTKTWREFPITGVVFVLMGGNYSER